MSAKKKWAKSFARISKELNIPVGTLQGYDKAGIDLNDPEAILAHRDIQSKSRGNPNLRVKREVKPIDFKSAVKGDDLKANIFKLREMAALKHQQYSTSLLDGNDAISSPILEDYLKTVKALAQIETTAPNVLALNKESVPIIDVEKAVNGTFFNVRQGLDNLASRLAELVVNKPAIEVSQIVTREVNSIIDDLYTNAFQKVKAVE